MGRRDRAPQRLRALTWHTVLVGVVLIMIFPVLWALLTSFKPDGQVFSSSPIGFPPTLDHYAGVLARWPVARLIGNTFLTASLVALAQLVIAVLAATGLAVVGRRGRRIILAGMAVSLAIPPQALIVPQFLMVAELGWRNTYPGLIVPQLGACAIAVLILVQHVDAIPPSLLGAARLEGARPLDVLGSVILPHLAPAMVAVFILTFITTWNEFLWPLIVAPREEMTTVQIGLTQFQTAEGNDYGGLLAAATLTSLPILIVYMVASRRITRAFLMSGAR